jgi:hypothetical protein
VQNRFYKGGVLLRIVFQVRILNDYNVAGCRTDTRTKRRTLTLIMFMVKNLIDEWSDIRPKNFPRTV